ncbi:MAG: pyridoxamine 5'-phosphate oxidase family protein [Planctomycetes bacterium]|nr:pyridoxamine 5'-phosphate oxidase family protein [Planctomycetota bacterium]
MNRADLLAYLRGPRYAVEASVSAAGQPQAAIMGIAVGDEFEIVFDTLGSTRKMTNLRANPRIALAIGNLAAGDGRGVQVEGVADEPAGAELARVQELYFAKFPEGRVRLGWPGITFVRVRPSWLRYCDYRGAQPLILEYSSDELRALE